MIFGLRLCELRRARGFGGAGRRSRGGPDLRQQRRAGTPHHLNAINQRLAQSKNRGERERLIEATHKIVQEDRGARQTQQRLNEATRAGDTRAVEYYERKVHPDADRRSRGEVSCPLSLLAYTAPWLDASGYRGCAVLSPAALLR